MLEALKTLAIGAVVLLVGVVGWSGFKAVLSGLSVDAGVVGLALPLAWVVGMAVRLGFED